MDQPYCVYCSLHTLDTQHEFTKDIDEFVKKINLTSQIPCKEVIISNLNDESKRLNNERESYQDQIKQINEQWGSEFVKLQDNYHQIKSSLDLCQKQNHELEKSNKERSSEIENLSINLQMKSKEVDDMMNIIKGHSQFQLSLREQNHKLSQELINSQAEIQTLNDFVNNMQKASQNSQVSNSFQSQYQQLQKDHKELQDQLQKAKLLSEQLKQDLVIKLNKLNNEHENKFNQLQDQLDGIFEKVKVVTIQNHLLINENNNQPSNDDPTDTLILKLDKLVNTLIHQNQIISSSNSQSKVLITALNQSISDQQTNILNLNNQNDQYKETEILLQNQIAALKLMVQQSSQEIDSLQKKSNEQLLQVNKYQSQIESLEKQRAIIDETYKAQIKDLQGKEFELQDQIKIKNMQIQQQMEQIYQLQEQMQKCQQDTDESQSNSNLQLAIQKQEKLIEQIEQQDKKILLQQQELDLQIEQNRRLQEQIKQSGQEIIKYQEQIETSSILLSNKNTEIEKLQEAGLDSQTQVNAKHSESIKQSEQKVTKYQEQIETLSSLVKNQNIEIEQLKGNIQIQQAELDLSIKENRKHVQSIKYSEQEIIQHQQQIETLSSSVSNLNTEIEQLKQNAQIQEAELDSQTKEKIKHIESIKQRDQQIMKYSEQIEILSCSVRNQDLEIEQFKGNAKTQQDKLDQQIEQYKKIQESVNQSEQQQFQYQEQLKSFSEQISEKELQLQNLKKNHQILLIEAENIQQSLQQQLAELDNVKNAEIKQLQDQIQTIRGQLQESLDDQINEKNSSNSSLKDSIIDYQSQTTTLENQIKELWNQIQSKDNLISNLERTQNVQIEKLQQELIEIKMKAEESNNALASVNLKLDQQSIKDFKDQIKVLKQYIEDIGVEHQNLVIDHNNQIKKIKYDHLQQVQLLEAQYQLEFIKTESLQQQINMLNQEFNQNINQSKELNGKLNNKDIQINQLTQQIMSQKSFIDDLQNQIVGLSHQFLEQQIQIELFQTYQHKNTSLEQQLIEQQDKHSQLVQSFTNLESKSLESEAKLENQIRIYDQLKLENISLESNLKKQIEQLISQTDHQSQSLTQQQIIVDQFKLQINQEQQMNQDLIMKLNQSEIDAQTINKLLKDNEEKYNAHIAKLTHSLRQFELINTKQIISHISDQDDNNRTNTRDELPVQIQELKQELLNQISISDKLSTELSNKDKQIQTILDQYSNVSDNLQAEISYLNGLLVKQDSGKLKIDTLNEQLLSQSSDAILIQGQFMKQVIESIQKSHPIQKFTLLYKGSRDKFTAQSFWYQIKGQGPFLFIMKLQTNQLVGVYTTIALSNDGTSSADESMTTFLFSITKQQIYQQRSTIKAVSTWMPGSNNLLSFGVGPDLVIDKEFNVQSTLNETYSTFGYQVTNSKTHLINSLKAKVMELLVFLL